MAAGDDKGEDDDAEDLEWRAFLDPIADNLKEAKPTNLLFLALTAKLSKLTVTKTNSTNFTIVLAKIHRKMKTFECRHASFSILCSMKYT